MGVGGSPAATWAVAGADADGGAGAWSRESLTETRDGCPPVVPLVLIRVMVVDESNISLEGGGLGTILSFHDSAADADADAELLL